MKQVSKGHTLGKSKQGQVYTVRKRTGEQCQHLTHLILDCVPSATRMWFPECRKKALSQAQWSVWLLGSGLPPSTTVDTSVSMGSTSMDSANCR